ncbi:MAG: VWA domain-containing protein [Legionellaceae bacterium]|nr:VWA domain-containing protein [Legionellaceae bacterium]
MFELATPWVLLAFPIPLLIWFLLPRASSQLSIALKVPFFKAMQTLVEHEKKTITNQRYLMLLFISWCFLLMALAGPRWVGTPRALSHDGYNIMLALDISPSMGINDMSLNGRRVTRLAVVKRAAQQFVEDRSGDKIGLILFGEQAYLLTPLTYDRHSVLMRLDDATVGLAGKSTSLGDALGLAIKRLQHVPTAGRMIILLTDGVSNSGVLPPLKAAELARTDGIKVYTIGLHSEIDPQSFSGMFLSSNGSADLDENTLKSVAQMTGGRYFRASNLQSLQRIYHDINKMARVSQEQATVRPQHEYYPWFLALGFGLFLYVLAQQNGLLTSVSITPKQGGEA